MGTKALRNKRRQREAKIAALDIPVAGNGETLEPGTPEYQRVIKTLAETLSNEELEGLIAHRQANKPNGN
jgi:hypothetical protein